MFFHETQFTSQQVNRIYQGKQREIPGGKENYCHLVRIIANLVAIMARRVTAEETRLADLGRAEYPYGFN